jgi:hypothetical protein
MQTKVFDNHNSVGTASAIWKYQRAHEETAQTACCRLPGNDEPSESKLGSNLGPDADQLGPKPCTTT